MNALKDHLFALKQTLLFFIRGRFLVYFIPGVVIALLFLFYYQSFSSYSSYLDTLTHIPWAGSYIESGLTTVYSWVDGIAIFLYQFTIISLLSPFHTHLSEKVDTAQTGRVFKTGWEKVINDIVRTLGVVILGGLLYLSFKLMWMILAWILGLSFLNPFVSALLIGFFTGFNSYDYSLERHNISVYKSWKFGFKHPLHILITGGFFSLLMLMPFVGVIIAPVFLTVIGTICFTRIQARSNQNLE